MNFNHYLLAILFFAKKKLVLRLNMCFSSFDDKILDEITEEELERNGFPFYEDDKTVTNQEFIEKAWYACVEHGYISTDYDILGSVVTLQIIL